MYVCSLFYRVFKEKSLGDVACFQKKKVGDLKDTLENYIQLQIKMAKKVRKKKCSNFWNNNH